MSKKFPRDCKVDTLERSTRRIYLLNRYYDPSTDQFLSIDPDLQTTGEPLCQVDPFTWTVTKIRGPLQFGVVCVWVATSLASR